MRPRPTTTDRRPGPPHGELRSHVAGTVDHARAAGRADAGEAFLPAAQLAVRRVHREGRPDVRHVPRSGRRRDRDRCDGEGRATLVTGSTYLFDMQVARFFAT